MTAAQTSGTLLAAHHLRRWLLSAVHGYMGDKAACESESRLWESSLALTNLPKQASIWNLSRLRYSRLPNCSGEAEFACVLHSSVVPWCLGYSTFSIIAWTIHVRSVHSLLLCSAAAGLSLSLSLISVHQSTPTGAFLCLSYIPDWAASRQHCQCLI